MNDKICAMTNALHATINAPFKYIAIDVDNASPEENDEITKVVEQLNSQRELAYYTPIYEAAKKFVAAFEEFAATPENLKKLQQRLKLHI